MHSLCDLYLDKIHPKYYNFFDDKGTILNFDEKSNLLWKNNVYKKRDRKHKPILYFAGNKDTLIVADNISSYYALNINNGKLIWSKENTSSFNSQVKIYNNKFFVVDHENTLKSYSIKNGDEIWNYKTDKSLIKSQQKLSISINKKDKNDEVYIKDINMSFGSMVKLMVKLYLQMTVFHYRIEI